MERRLVSIFVVNKSGFANKEKQALDSNVTAAIFPHDLDENISHESLVILVSYSIASSIAILYVSKFMAFIRLIAQHPTIHVRESQK